MRARRTITKDAALPPNEGTQGGPTPRRAPAPLHPAGGRDAATPRRSHGSTRLATPGSCRWPCRGHDGRRDGGDPGRTGAVGDDAVSGLVGVVAPKVDVTAMVAHALVPPIVAIRVDSAVLAAAESGPAPISSRGTCRVGSAGSRAAGPDWVFPERHGVRGHGGEPTMAPPRGGTAPRSRSICRSGDAGRLRVDDA